MKTRTAVAFVPKEPLEIVQVSVVRTFGTLWFGDRMETADRSRGQLFRFARLRRVQAGKAAGFRDLKP
jgi:hypothetical protein